jgi:hypothetical protein
MNEGQVLQSSIYKRDKLLHVAELSRIIRLDLCDPAEHSGDPLEIWILLVGANASWIFAKVDVGEEGRAAGVGGSFAEEVV